MPARMRRMTVPDARYPAGDGLTDDEFRLIRDLTLEVNKQDRRANRWLGVDNQKLLRAMRRKARAMAERSRLMYGQRAGDRLQAQADAAHRRFCDGLQLDWSRSI
jgi:hypothetical protein